MKQYRHLSPNKWYTPAGQSSKRTLYPSPQSLLRSSYTNDTTTYHWTSEGPTTMHIRAAAVFPRNAPIHNLLDNVEWGMIAFFDDKKMLVVSELRAKDWIDIAIEMGAEAWLINNNSASTWSWSEPQLDETGNKVRPACLKDAQSENINEAFRLKKPDKQRQFKDYDYQGVLSDLRAGELTHAAIGVKHGLSRNSIIKLAHRNGLKKIYVKT